MEDPRFVQKSIYGEGRGPPMLYMEPHSKPPPRKGKRRKLNPDATDTDVNQLLKHLKERQRAMFMDASQFSASQLPGGSGGKSALDPSLSYRAMAAYSLLRTLSVPLRLSPFTPMVFLRALYLPYPNKVLGQIHVALLRILLQQLQLGYAFKAKGRNWHKRRTLDNVRWPLRGGDNLTYLDGLSWPLFYDDYCHLTADRLYARFHDEELHLDFRFTGMQPLDMEQYDYKTFEDDDDDDYGYDDEGNQSSEQEEQQTPLMHLMQHQQKQQSPPKPLERGQRHGRNREYTGMDPSDSDSEYGDNVEDEDEDNDDSDDDCRRSSRPRGRRRGGGGSGKKKANKRSRALMTLPTNHHSATKNRGATIQKASLPPPPPIMKTPSKVMDMEVPIRPSLDHSTPTTKQENTDAALDILVGNTISQEEREKTTSTAESGNKGGPVNFFTPNVDASSEVAAEVGSTTPSSKKASPAAQVGFTSTPSPSHSNNLHNRRKLPLSSSSNKGSMPSSGAPPMASSMNKRPAAGDASTEPPVKKLATIVGAPNPQFQQQKQPTQVLQLQQVLQIQQQQQMELQRWAVLNGLSSIQGQGTLDPRLNFIPSQLNPYVAARLQMQQQQQQFMLQHLARAGSWAAATAPRAPPSHLPKRKQLEVEDEVAKVLRDFVCGKELEVVNDSDADKAIKASQDSKSDFEKRMYEQQWAHFEPIKKLRKDIPYHRLAPEEKLIMLEFLLDELLSLEEISAEFSKRKMMNDCHSLPYGTWPRQEEFSNLENDDECAVCGGEGELLCCDGCVRSYHRGCIDMPLGETLPDKWLCPECTYVDPATFGPLRGGAKASLDWFSMADLEMALRQEQMRRNFTLGYGNPSEAPFLGEMSGSLPPSHGSMGMAEQSAAALTVNNVSGANSSLQFLVVHGYVFCRSDTVEQPGEAPRVKDRSFILSFLDKLDPALRKAWPIIQIPTADESSSVHGRTIRHYLMPQESFDPNFYESKYRKAPISILMKAVGGAQVPKLMSMDFEAECNQISTSRLSEGLIRDFCWDHKIAQSLLHGQNLLDPHHVFRVYMLRLEALLRKSCLVDEFWEAGLPRNTAEIWNDKVKNAKSINRLARLLLQLVDRVHPRAFDEGWFHNPLAKGEEGVGDEGTQFEELASDWTVELESRKRIWEKTPSESILRLCEKEGFSLDIFVQGIREHISKPLLVSRSKRKQVKTCSPAVNGEILAARVSSDAKDPSANEATSVNLPKIVKPNTTTNVAEAHLGFNTISPAILTGERATAVASSKCAPDVTEAEVTSLVMSALISRKDGIVKGGSNTAPNPATNQTLATPSSETSSMHPPTPTVVEVTPDALSKEAPEPMQIEHWPSETLAAAVPQDDEKFKNSRSIAPSNEVAVNDTFEMNATPLATSAAVATTPVAVSEAVPDLMQVDQMTSETFSLPTLRDEAVSKDRCDARLSNDTFQPTEAGSQPSQEGAIGEPVDSMPTNGSNKKSNNNKTKKKQSDTIASGRRRSRRSVGRFAAVVNEAESTIDSTPTLEPVSRLAVRAGDSLEAQIQVCRLKKVPNVEKLVKGGFQRQMEWPICGRIPFATMGNLPPYEMRRLGRKGGVVKAAHVAYTSHHEVGQVCFAHVWRKQTEQCQSFEELILQFRTLDSFLDRSTIQSCENALRRGKTQTQKIVKISQRDPSNGLVEHFVVNSAKNRGRWVSSYHIDISGLVLDAYARRSKHIEKRNKFLQDKARAEREKELARRAAEAAAKKAREEAAARARAEEARIKARARAEATAKAQREAQARAQAQASLNAAMNLQRRHHNPGSSSLNPAPVATGAAFSSPHSMQDKLTIWNQKSDAIIMQHQMDLTALLNRCIETNTYPVPSVLLGGLRQTAIARLKKAGEDLMMSRSDENLATMVTNCEKQVFQSVTASHASGPNARSPQSHEITNNFGQADTLNGIQNFNNVRQDRTSIYSTYHQATGGSSTNEFNFSRQGRPSQPDQADEFDRIFDNHPNRSYEVPAAGETSSQAMHFREPQCYYSSSAHNPSLSHGQNGWNGFSDATVVDHNYHALNAAERNNYGGIPPPNRSGQTPGYFQDHSHQLQSQQQIPSTPNYPQQQLPQWPNSHFGPELPFSQQPAQYSPTPQQSIIDVLRREPQNTQPPMWGGPQINNDMVEILRQQLLQLQQQLSHPQGQTGGQQLPHQQPSQGQTGGQQISNDVAETLRQQLLQLQQQVSYQQHPQNQAPPPQGYFR